VFVGLGGSGAAAGGTAVKYGATKGTDTVNKNGLTVAITTYHHCITASSHYSNKSMEVGVANGRRHIEWLPLPILCLQELRFEDYAVGRKGASGATGGTLGGSLFGSGGGLGGTSTTGGMFGQNKGLGTGNTCKLLSFKCAASVL